MLGLKSKRALITGGASGIGKATAERFLEEGAQVLIFDRDPRACENIKLELPDLSAVILVDVSDPKAVEQAFIEADNLWGGLDICINNAGISMRHSFLDISPEEWQQVVDVNLNGMFYIAQGSARRMLAGEQG